MQPDLRHRFSWNDVIAAAHRGAIGATEAALVQAVNGSGKLTVNIRRIGLGDETPVKSSIDVTLLQQHHRHYLSQSPRPARPSAVIEDHVEDRAPRLISAQRGKPDWSMSA